MKFKFTIMRNFLVPMILLILTVNINAQSRLAQTLDHLSSNKEKYGFSEDQVKDWVVSDHYTTQHNGVEHIYLQQTISGIPIDLRISNVNVKANGEILNVNNKFVNVSNATYATSPTISAKQALENALADLEVPFNQFPRTLTTDNDLVQTTTFAALPKSKDDIKAQLRYYYNGKKGVALTWKLMIETQHDDFNYWYVHVNATNGEIIHKKDMVVRCQFGHKHHEHTDECTEDHHPKKPSNLPFYMYKPQTCTVSNSANFFAPDSYEAYPLGVESPNQGGRVTLVDPADPVASPFGWHDTDGVAGAEYTITRGNNVYAYEDQNDANAPGQSPDGGASLDFIFTQDLSQDPSTNGSVENLWSSITNLFVWNNYIHDVWFHYGFDEASGNFQRTNYSGQGIGFDAVNAECQDGGGTSNANFFTPADGGNGRMQMYMWDDSPWFKDGSLDNGIVTHEYGHGISNRLTGGPAADGCLGNAEQGGEGWSDYFTLAMTHEAGDDRNTARGIGIYANGSHIRQYMYSTDMSVNPHTYDGIKIAAIPHGVGSVLTVMLWELYWDLVDIYGYDPDLYNGTGGNNICNQLVIDGMKMQPCSPGFTDVRDAIIMADEVNYGGANYCTIWKAFARRGLGASAIQGSSSSVDDGEEAFDIPSDIDGVKITKTSDVIISNPGDTITYTVTYSTRCTDKSDVIISDDLPDDVTYVDGSASDGGTHNNGVLTWPTVATLTAEMDFSYTYKVVVNDDVEFNYQNLFNDDMESGDENWTVTNTTNLSNWQRIYFQQSFVWHAEELEADVFGEVTENQYLTMGPILLNGVADFSFRHKYDTEVNWDGGRVELSIDNGLSWIDFGPYFTENGYNDYIQNEPSEEAFSGNSFSFIVSKADLSAFCGQNALIRFNFYYDPLEDGRGWHVDDVCINTSNGIINLAMAEAGGIVNTATNCVQVEGQIPSDHQCFDTNIPTVNLAESTTDIKVHPNPSHGESLFLTIHSDKVIGDIDFSIFNAAGQLVFEARKTILDQETTFELIDRKLPTGMYTVHIKGDEFKSIEKFIVLQ